MRNVYMSRAAVNHDAYSRFDILTASLDSKAFQWPHPNNMSRSRLHNALVWPVIKDVIDCNHICLVGADETTERANKHVGQAQGLGLQSHRALEGNFNRHLKTGIGYLKAGSHPHLQSDAKCYITADPHHHLKS